MIDLFVARNILFYVGNQKTSRAKELYETYYLWGTFAVPKVHQETPCIYLSYDLWTVKGQTWMSIQSQSWIVLLTSEARKIVQHQGNCFIKWSVCCTKSYVTCTVTLTGWRTGASIRWMPTTLPKPSKQKSLKCNTIIFFKNQNSVYIPYNSQKNHNKFNKYIKGLY